MRLADVFVRVRADLTELNKSLSTLDKQVATQASKIGTSLMTVGKGTTQVGDAMTRNLTLPIIGIGAATSKMALDFETTMNQLVGLANVPREEIAGIREDILKMGGEVGKSPQELAEAFYFVASAGFQANEAMEVLRESAKASAAGMGSVQSVAKVLGSVINAYGHDNLSAATAVDALTAAVADGTAEADEFAGVLGRVAPAAANLHVSFDQVTAALAGMTNVGLSAEESATSLNQVFVSLIKPTAQAEDALKGMGLSAAGLREELKTKGLLATLRTLEDRFRGNDEAAAQVFGNVRALRGVTSLLSLDQSQLNGIFNDTANSAGRLAQAYEDTEGPQRDLQRNLAELQAVGIELGEDVLPVVVDILHELAGGAKEFGKFWNGLDDGTKRNIVQWAAWIAVAGPALSIIGRITTGLGGLTKGFGYLSTSLGKAAKAAGMGKLAFLGLSAAIAAGGIALGEQYSDALDELTNKIFRDFARQSNKTAADAQRDAMTIADAFGVDLPEAEKRLVEKTHEMNGDWAAAMQALIDEAGGVGPAVRAEMDRTAEIMAHAASERKDAAALSGKQTGDALASGLKGRAKEIYDASQQATDPIAAATEQATQEAVAAVAKMFKDMTSVLTSQDDFKAKWQAFVKTLEDPWTTHARRIAIEAKLASKNLQEGLTSKDPVIRANSVNLVEDLISQYELLAPAALEKGKLVNPALLKGLKHNVHLAYQEAKDIAEQTGKDLDFQQWASDAGLDGLLAFIQAMEHQRERAKQKALQIAGETAAAAGSRSQQFFEGGAVAGGRFAAGLDSQQGAADRAGDRLGEAGKPEADFYSGGLAAALSWAAGLNAPSAIAAVQHAGAVLASTAGGYVEGRSPPPKGPLHHIDKGAENVIKAWADAALGMRSHVAASFGQLAAAATGGLAMSPAFGGLATPALLGSSHLSSAESVAGSGGDTIINVPVQGLIRAETGEDIARPIRMLAESGVLARPKRYTPKKGE